MEKKLNEMAIKESGIITKVDGNKTIRRRLLDMGVVSNTKITMVKLAPLGDPIQVHLRGYELTLRKSEAQIVSVEIDNGGEKHD
ncbi:MAG: ferrous iron transport protein A [Acholeplasmatales bacterium]|jgi:Fe2+ transport system protein FeoA|nr:ferrous iron transport protein A [Acholeplasmatales bacterium]